MSQLPEASIRTSNSLQLAERRRAAVPRGVATATPLFIERAENAEVWDVEGRAHELGLLLLTGGTQGEAIRLLFPLTAATELVEEGLELLARALEVA